MQGVPLADIYDNIKGVFNTFIRIRRPGSNRLAIGSSIETEHIKIVLCSNGQ